MISKTKNFIRYNLQQQTFCGKILKVQNQYRFNALYYYFIVDMSLKSI